MIWFIAAPPGNLVLLEVMKRVCFNLMTYTKTLNKVGYEAVINTTGPIAYSKTILDFQYSNWINKINYKQLGLYPSLFEKSAQNITQEHFIEKDGHYSVQKNKVVVASVLKRTQELIRG